MKRMAWLMTAAATAWLAPGTLAQQSPDFSGRWTSEPEQTAAGPRRGPQAGAGVRRGAQRGTRGQRGGRGRGRGRGRGGRAGDMGSGWGSNLTVTQDEKQLVIEYAFFVRGDLQPPLRFVYALDGSETTNSVMMGRGIQEQKSRTAWDTDKLVITTVHTFQNPDTGDEIPVEVTQTLSLESPTSMIVETTRAGVLGGPTTTTRTVYRKV